MFVHPQFKNITLKPFLKKFSEAKLEQKLAKFFPEKDVVFTDSGRSAFQLAIKELNLENSEMLIPAYICSNLLPIFFHYNIKPIYLDINLATFNVASSEIERKITPETKSILVCHTYGLPNDMDKILEIAGKYNLKIIEDCAHAFGAKFQNKYLGNFGDCAFFSLPKFLPVVSGGMLVCGGVCRGATPTKPPTKLRGRTPKLSPKLSDLIKFLRLFPCLAAFSEKFRRSYEKNNEFALPKKPFKCSLRILDWHLDNLEKTLQKRIELAKYFQEKLQRFGFQVSPGITYVSALVPKNINRDELFNKLRKYHIFCSRIWHKPIYPNLPNTAEAAKRIINFPLQNWFTKKDIDKIINGILSKMDSPF